MTTIAPVHTGTAGTAARWLAAATAVLVARASAAGVWADGVYPDGPAVEAMFRGYDLVTLTGVAPMLVATLLPVWRERPAAQLVRVSLLVFCVYNYAYYLFGAQLNAALLGHIAIVTTSGYALVLTLITLDLDRLAAAFRPGTPVRAVAVILGLLAVPFAAIQVSGLAGFALTGATPQEPSQLVVPLVFTRLGAVLDLSLLVPAYLLASVVLLAGALHQLSYIAGMLVQLSAEIPGAAFDPYEPVIVTLFALGSGLLLANLRRPGPQTTPTQQDRVLTTAGR